MRKYLKYFTLLLHHCIYIYIYIYIHLYGWIRTNGYLYNHYHMSNGNFYNLT
jgi:hypothetical protein